ncbi:MAG: UDP-4-amino-4,6-dideoxy-N-acetyl-beta-L-altrosamine N-acetyltransferase [Piscirickettsiaceae bacterium]|nr:MAG: UDP-4-amino-4,6-dideoxy-N-acetyl-beta-L-altrosamine N-acetyltransferase [Piscirickettsiaceae bacterium]
MTGFPRDMKLSDLTIIREWRNDPEINHYMFSQHKITQVEHQLWFERSQNNPLLHLNVYVENQGVKGFVQLQNKSPEDKVYEWGFYMSPTATSGTGTKMAKLILNKVFEEMNGKKLFGEVLAFNNPSIRFHQKLGFSQEGVLREHVFLNDEYHDVYCFGILKSEWEKRNTH